MSSRILCGNQLQAAAHGNCCTSSRRLLFAPSVNPHGNAAAPTPGQRTVSGRSRATAVNPQAKLKYNTKIAQNHSKGSSIRLDLERFYSDPKYKPGPQYGPIQVKEIPGKGRGIVAQSDIGASDTVMVLEPAGHVLHAPANRELLPEHLVHALVQQELGQVDRVRVRLLQGMAGSARQGHMPCFSLEDLQKLSDKLRRASATPTKAKGKGFGAASQAGAAQQAGAGSSGMSAADLAALGEAPVTREELDAVCPSNAYGDRANDQAIAALRREQAQAFIGLWPELALMNHSCVPNTYYFAVGDYLLVRAMRDVPAGTEVDVSYIGEMALAPVRERHEVLQQAYGFECGCARCQGELTAPPALQLAVATTFSHVQQPGCTVHDAWQAVQLGDEAACAALQEEVAQLVERLEGLLDEHAVTPQLRAWLRASAFQAYEVLAILLDRPSQQQQQQQAGVLFGAAAGAGAAAQGPELTAMSDPAVPRRLMETVAAVLPGSDRHLALGVEYMVRAADAYGRDDERVEEPVKSCLGAHALRYGAVPDGTFKQLVEMRFTLSTYLGRTDFFAAKDGPTAGMSAEENALRGMAIKAAEGLVA